VSEHYAPRSAGIVDIVRAAFTATAATIAALSITLPAPALAKGPSANQIHRAVSRAEGSSSLWATVNVCSSKGKGRGGELGVRGQMPALGFDATLRMTVQLGFWSQKHERFIPIDGTHATSNLSLGSPSSGLQQDGVMYGFDNSAGLLNASIDFTWTRGGRVIGEASRITTSGHPDADYAQPAHYSASHCRPG
jgi:hypothetical protein